MGKIYENAVAIELIKRFDKENIFYWKCSKHEEVDFIVKKGLKIEQLIQVCYSLDSQETKKRETKALLKASKELGCRNLLVLTEDFESEQKLGGIKIVYVPLWRWLLQQK